MGPVPAGSDFEHAFDTPGAYPYFCAIHPDMVGTITVAGDDLPSSEGAAIESPDPGESATGDVAQTDVAVASEPAAVSIVDLTFEPGTIEVDAGATVTWANDDGVPHTVTALEEYFNSGVVMGGDSFSQTFETSGSYDYFCAIHPSMTGTVVVREPVAPDDAGDAAGGPTTDAATAVTEVSVVDVAFQPADIEVPAGTTVGWTNEDPFAHTVTARDGAFDSGAMDGGVTYSQTFEQPGSYDYFCAIHPSMTGTVTVSEPAP